MQAKAVQQLSGEGLGFGGQNRPVHPLSLQLLQPLHQARERSVKGQPGGTVLPNGLISGGIECCLQLLRLPSTPLQCRGLRLPIRLQPNLKVQRWQLSGQQHHLPTVMHQRPQLTEGVWHLIGLSLIHI